MDISSNIKKIRKEKGITLSDIAKSCGVSVPTAQRWESGAIKQFRYERICAIAVALGVHPTILMGWDDDKPIIKPKCDADEFIHFPVIGSISAGYGGRAMEEFTGDEELIPLSELRGKRGENFFVLQVVGNSMYPQILNGDRVLVERCDSVDSGSIAVVLYNGDEATIKKVVYTYGEDWMELIPANPEYQPKHIEGTDLSKCKVLGRVVKLMRNF